MAADQHLLAVPDKKLVFKKDNTSMVFPFFLLVVHSSKRFYTYTSVMLIISAS